MSFISKMFAGGAATLIDSVGSAIDKCVTSDEERLQIKTVLDSQIQSFELSLEQEAMKFEGEVSKRHLADMTSDSWLSKNIRPLTLGFLISSTVVLAYATIFGTLTPEQSKMVAPWMTLLTTLDVTAITFYFGSRGFEAVNRIKK